MGTYQSSFISSSILVFVTFLAWCFAAWLISSLSRRRSWNSLKLAFWLSFGLLILITGLNLGRLVLILQLGANGFELIPVNSLVSLAFLLLPLIFTLGWSVPGLWRLSLRQPKPAALKPAQAEPHDQPPPDLTNWKTLDDQTRAGLAAPSLVVPAQLGLVGALLANLIVLAAPSLILTGVSLAVLLVFGLWRWFRQAGYSRSLGEKGAGAIPRFRLRLGRLAALALIFVAGFGLLIFIALTTSRLPDRYAMAAGMMAGGQAMQMAPGPKMLSVTDLTGPQDGTPDRRFTLTAQQARLKLDSGQVVEAWTFNGQIPGPELRVKQGELVEVTLTNRDIAGGVTLHWHGVDVPNAEDGVAGLTQNAVMPGQSFVYRFRAPDTGTYWYHSHQFSADEVKLGLFGAFIVEPPGPPAAANTLDLPVLAHTWQTDSGPVASFGPGGANQRQTVAPGTPVRLRLINTDSTPMTFTLTGTPFQVAAIDGTDLNGPGNLDQSRVLLAARGP
jgi:hypothetical protein